MADKANPPYAATSDKKKPKPGSHETAQGAVTGGGQPDPIVDTEKAKKIKSKEAEQEESEAGSNHLESVDHGKDYASGDGEDDASENGDDDASDEDQDDASDNEDDATSDRPTEVTVMAADNVAAMPAAVDHAQRSPPTTNSMGEAGSSSNPMHVMETTGGEQPLPTAAEVGPADMHDSGKGRVIYDSHAGNVSLNASGAPVSFVQGDVAKDSGLLFPLHIRIQLDREYHPASDSPEHLAGLEFHPALIAATHLWTGSMDQQGLFLTMSVSARLLLAELDVSSDPNLARDRFWQFVCKPTPTLTDVDILWLKDTNGKDPLGVDLPNDEGRAGVSVRRVVNLIMAVEDDWQETLMTKEMEEEVERQEGEKKRLAEEAQTKKEEQDRINKGIRGKKLQDLRSTASRRKELEAGTEPTQAEVEPSGFSTAAAVPGDAASSSGRRVRFATQIPVDAATATPRTRRGKTAGAEQQQTEPITPSAARMSTRSVTGRLPPRRALSPQPTPKPTATPSVSKKGTGKSTETRGEPAGQAQSGGETRKRTTRQSEVPKATVPSTKGDAGSKTGAAAKTASDPKGGSGSKGDSNTKQASGSKGGSSSKGASRSKQSTVAQPDTTSQGDLVPQKATKAAGGPQGERRSAPAVSRQVRKVQARDPSEPFNKVSDNESHESADDERESSGQDSASEEEQAPAVPLKKCQLPPKDLLDMDAAWARKAAGK